MMVANFCGWATAHTNKSIALWFGPTQLASLKSLAHHGTQREGLFNPAHATGVFLQLVQVLVRVNHHLDVSVHPRIFRNEVADSVHGGPSSADVFGTAIFGSLQGPDLAG